MLSCYPCCLEVPEKFVQWVGGGVESEFSVMLWPRQSQTIIHFKFALIEVMKCSKAYSLGPKANS